MRWLFGVAAFMLLACDGKKDAEIAALKSEVERLTAGPTDEANLAACERVPKCDKMTIPAGHQLCVEWGGVRRKATAAEIEEAKRTGR